MYLARGVGICGVSRPSIQQILGYNKSLKVSNVQSTAMGIAGNRDQVLVFWWFYLHILPGSDHSSHCHLPGLNSYPIL